MKPLKYPLYVIGSCVAIYITCLLCGPRIINNKAISNHQKIRIGGSLQDVESLLGEPVRIVELDSQFSKHQYDVSQSLILSEKLHLTISNDTVVDFKIIVD